MRTGRRERRAVREGGGWCGSGAERRGAVLDAMRDRVEGGVVFVQETCSESSGGVWRGRVMMR